MDFSQQIGKIRQGIFVDKLKGYLFAILCFRQATYLANHLLELKRKCNPELSVSSDLSQMKGSKLAQQHKTARAANRVAAYASTID